MLETIDNGRVVTCGFNFSGLNADSGALFRVGEFYVDSECVDFAKKNEVAVKSIVAKFCSGDFGYALPGLVAKNNANISKENDCLHAYYYIESTLVYLKKDFKEDDVTMLCADIADDFYRYHTIVERTPVDNSNYRDLRALALRDGVAYSPAMAIVMETLKIKTKRLPRSEQVDTVMDKLIYRYVTGDFGLVGGRTKKSNLAAIKKDGSRCFIVGEYDLYKGERVIIFTFPCTEKALVVLSSEFRRFYDMWQEAVSPGLRGWFGRLKLKMKKVFFALQRKKLANILSLRA